MSELIQQAIDLIVKCCIAIALCILILSGSGCSLMAGHQAMVIPSRQVSEPCGIKICKPSGVSNRIDPKKDCVCSGSQSMPEIL